jgi:hypothetical protein
MNVRGFVGAMVALGGWPGASGAVSWERLEAGQSPAEVRAFLGEPLMRSAGRGFEVWIYDQQREVVWMRGVVVAWTAREPALDERGRELDLRGVGKVKEQPEAAKKKPYVPRSEENFGYERASSRWRGRSF